ncbi:RNase A-like domain-containing protein [Methylobacterium sp.]|uniref:RNase A-like domain-containing protein n=1 Tax=Methylobacterium sp. TaxID=409 RepID=UPI0025CC7EF5|nr:RNase A-like domain-containing protein [Methylobacterium sp.]
MSLSRETTMSHIRWQLDAMRVSLAFIRVDLALRGYNPNQPRVPAGSSEGGRWTEGDSGNDAVSSPSDLPTRFVQFDPGQGRSIDLREEEARGGHALREHVGKTDEELLARVRASKLTFPVVIFGLRRDGSFESIESANDFVNRTLEENASEVALVASGKEKKAFLKTRFGYKTGREAYTAGRLDPYMRNTYGVGVYILHDPHGKNGFRVYTAYPRNDGD